MLLLPWSMEGGSHLYSYSSPCHRQHWRPLFQHPLLPLLMLLLLLLRELLFSESFTFLRAFLPKPETCDHWGWWCVIIHCTWWTKDVVGVIDFFPFKILGNSFKSKSVPPTKSQPPQFGSDVQSFRLSVSHLLCPPSTRRPTDVNTRICRNCG